MCVRSWVNKVKGAVELKREWEKDEIDQGEERIKIRKPDTITAAGKRYRKDLFKSQ